MAYDSKQIMESETAYRVLREIATNEEGSYPKEISEKVDSHANTVSDMIKVMRDMGFIERGKRTKAQFYTLDIEGLYKYWIKDIQKNAENIVESEDSEILEDRLNEFKAKISPEEDFISINKDDYGRASTFFYRYILQYFEEVESSSVKEMLYDDIVSGFNMLDNSIEPGNIIYTTHLPEEIAYLVDILELIANPLSNWRISANALKKEMELKRFNEGEREVSEDIDEVREELREKQQKFRDFESLVKWYYNETDFKEKELIDLVQRNIEEERRKKDQ